MEPDQTKLFTKADLLLIPFGVALNILMAQLVLALRLPVFLDAVGTIFVAATGGLLPGVMVGFFSNCINSIGDPITLYYGIISVLLAILGVVLTKRRVFCSLWKTLLSSIAFALIGGALGSGLTWLLSGLSYGSGVSSPFVTALHIRYGLAPFLAQISADFLLDLIDKIVTVLAVYGMLRLAPKKCLDSVPFGYLYLPASANGEDADGADTQDDMRGDGTCR